MCETDLLYLLLIRNILFFHYFPVLRQMKITEIDLLITQTSEGEIKTQFM